MKTRELMAIVFLIIVASIMLVLSIMEPLNP